MGSLKKEMITRIKKIHVARIVFINSALLNLVIDNLSADIAESLAENYYSQLIS